jgi:dienelactone hydrolase
VCANESPGVVVVCRAVVTALIVVVVSLFGIGVLPPPTPAYAADRVQFPSANSDHMTMTGELTRPSGTGPFPAVVFLPGCDGGLDDINQHYRGFFQHQGYVVLFVDENGSRHVGNVCSHSEGTLPLLRIATDAVGAHAYLRSLSYVDANRIALIGWSWGGTAALVASNKGLAPSTGAPNDSFRAVVSFYPQCGYLVKYAEDARVPVLILIGQGDDWASPSECSQGVQASQQNGQPVSMQTFPRAVHAFDTSSRTIVYLGHHLAYDATAANAARTAMMSFLGENLK